MFQHFLHLDPDYSAAWQNNQKRVEGGLKKLLFTFNFEAHLVKLEPCSLQNS